MTFTKMETILARDNNYYMANNQGHYYKLAEDRQVRDLPRSGPNAKEEISWCFYTCTDITSFSPMLQNGINRSSFGSC